MSFKRDRRGFTLVELVAAMGILALIVGIVGGFVVSGARASGSVQSGVSLQIRLQMVQNQLRECLVDAAGGVFWDGDSKTLTVYPEADGTGVRVFWLDSETDTLMYREGGEEAPLAARVTDFSVKLTENSAAAPANSATASAAAVTVTMVSGQKSRADTQVAALRNHPAYEKTLAALKTRLGLA